MARLYVRCDGCHKEAAGACVGAARCVGGPRAPPVPRPVGGSWAGGEPLYIPPHRQRAAPLAGRFDQHQRHLLTLAEQQDRVHLHGQRVARVDGEDFEAVHAGDSSGGGETASTQRGSPKVLPRGTMRGATATTFPSLRTES